MDDKKFEDLVRKIVREECKKIFRENSSNFVTKEELDDKASTALGIAMGASI